MIVNVKFFHEKTDDDYIAYNKIWDENKERFIFLQHHLPLSDQMSIIKNDIMDNYKDILAIRFPSNTDIQNNKIMNTILLGKGITYDNNKIWYPTEIWIYNPIH